MEALSIVTINVLPDLARTPDGSILILFVDGRPFFAIGPSPGFTVLGKALTWISTLYSVPPGAEVIAVYTSPSPFSESPIPPTGGWSSLPTTKPSVPGVLWNNSGVVCVSA